MYEQQFNPYAANLAVVKGYFNRGKVLTRGVLQIISVALSILTSILMVVFAKDFFSDIYRLSSLVTNGNIDLDSSYFSQATDIAASSMAGTLIPTLFSAVIPVLIGAAFIVICTGSRKENGSPKAGVTILYVLSMIGMILMCIATGFVAIVGIFAIIMLNAVPGSVDNYYFNVNGQPVPLDYQAFTIAFTVLLIFILLIIVYALLYSIHQFRFYASVRKSITTVELQNKGAKAFGVMSVINAIFTGFSLLYAFFVIAAIASLGFSSPVIILFVFSLLASVLQFVMLILDASIALGYNKYIENMKYGYNGTPYDGITEGNYAPAAPVATPYAAPRQPQGDFGAQQNPYAPQPPYGAPASYGEPTPYPSPAAPVSEQPVDSYADTREPIAEPEPESVPETEPLAQPEPIAQPEPQQPTPVLSYCTSCGKPVTPGAVYCTNCGHRIN